MEINKRYSNGKSSRKRDGWAAAIYPGWSPSASCWGGWASIIYYLRHVGVPLPRLGGGGVMGFGIIWTWVSLSVLETGWRGSLSMYNSQKYYWILHACTLGVYSDNNVIQPIIGNGDRDSSMIKIMNRYRTLINTPNVQKKTQNMTILPGYDYIKTPGLDFYISR